MKITLSILLTALYFFSIQIKASPLLVSCDKLNKGDTEYGQCLDQAIESIDRTLSTWIENQTYKLEVVANATGRKTVIKLFKKSHLDFVSYRKNDCHWQYLVISPDKSAAATYKTCYISLTHKRIEQLKIFNKDK